MATTVGVGYPKKAPRCSRSRHSVRPARRAGLRQRGRIQSGNSVFSLPLTSACCTETVEALFPCWEVRGLLLQEPDKFSQFRNIQIGYSPEIHSGAGPVQNVKALSG